MLVDCNTCRGGVYAGRTSRMIHPQHCDNAILSPMAHGHTMTVKSIVLNVVCVFVIAPILAALILWGCWVLIPEQPPPPTVGSTTSAHSAVIRPAPHTPVSGRTVYMANCAKCHGETGDGNGTETLDRPARSFLAGGFSFGNTQKAITRVVQHGIAGTPMPGFAGTLSPAQTKAVVRYVLNMAPDVAADTSASELVVEDRPLVLRGMLPARGPWDQTQPRGVLLGGTDGLTLAYDTDDVRFRTARQGGFARRTDWEGRGGTPIEPLGQPIHWSSAGPMFFKGGDPIASTFKGTSVHGNRASIRYALPDANIAEWGAARARGALAGYARVLDISGDAAGYTMALPAVDPPMLLGTQDAWAWWRSGEDLIGVRGAAPAAGGVSLPANGEVEVLVLPGVSDAAARAAGLPVREVAS